MNLEKTVKEEYETVKERKISELKQSECSKVLQELFEVWSHDLESVGSESYHG